MKKKLHVVGGDLKGSAFYLSMDVSYSQIITIYYLGAARKREGSSLFSIINKRQKVTSHDLSFQDKWIRIHSKRSCEAQGSRGRTVSEWYWITRRCLISDSYSNSLNRFWNILNGWRFLVLQLLLKSNKTNSESSLVFLLAGKGRCFMLWNCVSFLLLDYPSFFLCILLQTYFTPTGH